MGVGIYWGWEYIGPHASECPIHLWYDLAHNLGSAYGCENDVLGRPIAITPQLPRGAIYSLLGDDMDCVHESMFPKFS